MDQVRNNKITLLDLFLTFFRINAITFGGGYTIVAVLRDELVMKRKIFKEEEMLDLTALAQSGPGAMAINTSILTGYKLRGIPGAIACLSASVLPCIIIITIISYFYQEFKENFYINAALKGMAGIIAGVLVVTTINLGKNALKNRPLFSAIIMSTAFILAYFFKINSGVIILVFALFGLVVFSLVKEDAIK